MFIILKAMLISFGINKLMIEDIENQASLIQMAVKKRPKSKNHLQIQSFKSSLGTTAVFEPPQAEDERQCRICLDGETTEQNPLLAPCKCIGSVKYVHNTCYRKWIERIYANKDKQEQAILLKEGVQCEMCKEKISLNFDIKYTCMKCSRFKEKVNKNKPLFLLFLVFILLNIGTVTYLLSYLFSSLQAISSSLITLILIITSFTFLGLTLFVTMYYFVTDYTIDKTWILKSFELKKKNIPKPSRRYQVVPVSVQQVAQ